MKDRAIIVLGIGAFLVVAAFPFWYTWGVGDGGYVPKIETPEGKCVESKEYMKSWHMDLLNEWRDAVVREGRRIHVSREHNTRHEMSLTKTCLKCHAQKDKFCDRCHDYLGVDPYCFDCHVTTEGM